jgi:hypothetical protein
MYTQELTREFLTHATDEPMSVIENRVERIPERVEGSYEAVAMVERKTPSQNQDEPAYTLRVIRKKNADNVEIQRAIHSVHHWIVSGGLENE